MAKKQVTPAPAAVTAFATPPHVPQLPEQPPELVVEAVAVEASPIRTVAVVRLQAGYTQCRSAGVVFGPNPIEFALDDPRLPEFRACKYLMVD